MLPAFEPLCDYYDKHLRNCDPKVFGAAYLYLNGTISVEGERKAYVADQFAWFKEYFAPEIARRQAKYSPFDKAPLEYWHGLTQKGPSTLWFCHAMIQFYSTREYQKNTGSATKEIIAIARRIDPVGMNIKRTWKGVTRSISYSVALYFAFIARLTSCVFFILLLGETAFRSIDLHNTKKLPNMMKCAQLAIGTAVAFCTASRLENYWMNIDYGDFLNENRMEKYQKAIEILQQHCSKLDEAFNN